MDGTDLAHQQKIDAALKPILEALPAYRGKAEELRDVLLANLAMAGELPAPTFHEERRAQFLRDRFSECDLENCSMDEVGNVYAVIPGTKRDRSILMLAHLDSPVSDTEDHTITINPQTARGATVGENSLGVATLATFPTLLDALDLELESDVVLMGGARSLGKGNLEGIRFFLENNDRNITHGICVEGVELGRLSFSSLGMLRAEIRCEVPESYDWSRFGASGAIVMMNDIINQMVAIPLPQRPRSRIVFGKMVGGGDSFNKVATRSTLRFEIRSESDDVVREVARRVDEIIAEEGSQSGANTQLDVIARSSPGGLAFDHPLARSARQVMETLEIQPRIAPSTSDLSVLIDKGIPGLTLGISHGSEPEAAVESVEIAPMFSGLAQLLGVMQAIDKGITDEH